LLQAASGREESFSDLRAGADPNVGLRDNYQALHGQNSTSNILNSTPQSCHSVTAPTKRLRARLAAIDEFPPVVQELTLRMF
jgi:hypothetical protein